MLNKSITVLLINGIFIHLQFGGVTENIDNALHIFDLDIQ